MERRTLLQMLGGGVASGLIPLPSFGREVAAQGVSPVGSAYAGPSPQAMEAASLNVGWRFYQGDVTPPPLREQSQSYMAAKAGGSKGAAAPNFNDSEWRTVDLPHDWAIESPPAASENIAQGYRKRGYGWYRRAITLDPSLAGRYLEIQFGAIATNATVWFNGSPVAHNWSGYNGFNIDITAMATFGEKPNVLSVRVDAETAEGWWYEGAGIYRNVWLVDRAPISIITDGVHADPRQGADGKWHIPVAVTVYSIEKQSAKIELVAELLDESGAVVAKTNAAIDVKPLWCTSVQADIDLVNPKLWSVETPNLYRIRTRLIRKGAVVDERITPCGFRTIRFDPANGFFLNGQSVKIKGVCLHQDHAGVGVAVPPALVEWRVQQIKAMGANAIRCSHGAPDAAFLDACDRLGILVMNENRNFNVSPDYIEQLEWLVRRDRNRPSVILWSVFNEEPLQGTSVGFEMVRRATAAVKALDDSRPVTAAMNAGFFTPVNVSQAVDVVGFNYQHLNYDRFHKENPGVPILSSEDTSAFMTRGAWETDKPNKVESSDDTQAAGWGLTQRLSWKAIDSRPFMAGGFVWTGFDYHGEPTPFKWPANSSYFGILDLCGFPKSAFYIRRAMWVKDKPLLDILPHWNWQGREGKSINVMLATNLDRVVLRLNGKIVGDGKPDPYEMISFAVPYAPGTLEARGWRGGKVVATSRVETTGVPANLRLTASRPQLAGDGVDATPVTIEALDVKGRPVPTFNGDVDLHIEGGKIIGVGNGDPTSVLPSKGNRVRIFNGLAQAIVQSARGSSGKLVFSGRSDGLGAGELTIQITPADLRQSLPPAFQLNVASWRQSPVLHEKPTVIPVLADNDMNSWDPVVAGERVSTPSEDGFILLLTQVNLTDTMSKLGALISFTSLAGRGDVYVDGKPVAHKSEEGPGGLSASIPKGKREIVIALILEAAKGVPLGLAGAVHIMPSQ